MHKPLKSPGGKTALGTRQPKDTHRGFPQAWLQSGMGCIGSAWPSSGSGGHRGGFCDKEPETSPVYNTANATGSRTDLPPAKARDNSDRGNSSVITYL